MSPRSNSLIVSGSFDSMPVVMSKRLMHNMDEYTDRNDERLAHLLRGDCELAASPLSEAVSSGPTDTEHTRIPCGCRI